VKDEYRISIWCDYDFNDPAFRDEYDEWRDDHPDGEMMRLGFITDRFAPEDIMHFLDPNSRKEIN
jgi:hypothetical protein